MRILGISAFYHDSAAAIVEDGEIIAAVQEERFSRVKNDASFPKEAIKYCLEEAELTIDELDSVVFYDKPFLKFERLVDTYYQWAPKGLSSFIKAMTTWLNEKLFLKKIIRNQLKQIGDYDLKKLKLEFSEHHLSHAASTYYPSPFTDAAILTIDGVGEWATTSMYKGKGNDIISIKELHFPNSLGLLYSSFTYFLGFKVNSGEYKLMGLAPYGNRNGERVKNYVSKIKDKLIDIKGDGSFELNQKYFTYSVGSKMIKDSVWEDLFNIKRRNPEDELLQEHCDLASGIQIITEEIVILLAKELRKVSTSKNLCLAGGVALNCVSNGKLAELNIFDNIYVQPAAGDAGGALGAALVSYYLSEEANIKQSIDSMKGSYLGPEFSNKEIKEYLDKHDINAKYYQEEQLFSKIAKEIKEDKAIGWFQGRLEFGPRALGNRSILGNPKSSETQFKLNVKVKNRESFRPFAPAILSEDVKKYFPSCESSPYMLMVHEVSDEQKEEVPINYEELGIKEKLYTKRSSLPAVTHVDFTGRIQGVSKETNSRFYSLIKEVKRISGDGVVVNTSFNVRGEPIVCTPDDAYKCFVQTDMDLLVMGNYVISK